jgi:hypothetical protein
VCRLGTAGCILLIVCSSAVYPVKGQTVLVKAPGVKTCYMHSESKPNAKNGESTNLMPCGRV